MKNKINLLIGIDPGVRTGFAVKNLDTGKLQRVESMKIHEAMAEVARYAAMEEATVHVIVEDARMRVWFGKSGREKLQGAGSIKRDSSIWEDYLQSIAKVGYFMRKPAANATKWSSEFFQNAAKWKGSTNEHARDAAILILGMDKMNVRMMNWQNPQPITLGHSKLKTQNSKLKTKNAPR